MLIQLEWWQLVLPVVIVAVVMGLYMGWRVMGLWTVGVFFSGIVAAKLGPKLDLLLNKVLNVGGQFVAIATDKPEGSISTPQITIASPMEPLATAGLFTLLVVLSWWIARKLAARGGSGILDNLIGGVFGALASVVALSQGFDYWTDYVKRSGTNPTTSTPQLTVGIATMPEANPLMGMATAAIGLFLLIIIVYTVWRAVKAAS
ncbi:MAG: hypothetical protein ABI670_05830 [Chloroflexota bacterium]